MGGGVFMQWSVKRKKRAGWREGGREEEKEESKITFYIYKVFQGESPNTCHRVCATALAQRSWQGKPCR